MRALLLAAGLGTRLRPLTDVLPKCLAPVRGRPLLEYWLERVFAAGAQHAVVNTHHHAPLVAEYVRGTPWRERVTLAHEPELLGTGGTVLRQAALLAGGPFLVAHADNLSLLDCRALMAAHARRPAECAMTMLTYVTRHPRNSGIVALDARGVVREFHEKVANPPGNLANGAVYVFEPAVVDFLRGLGKPVIDLSTEVIPAFVGRIATCHTDAYHEDIGSMERWRLAQSEYPGAAPSPPSPDPWQELLARHPAARETVAALLAAPSA